MSNLENKFKSKESQYRNVIERRSLYAIRVDGRAFKNYTSKFEKPFDTKFMNGMDQTCVALCNEVAGAILGYVQSDEISVIFSDLSGEKTEMWFGGKQDKIISIAASTATGALIKALGSNPTPMFDARILKLDNVNEAEEYLAWRSGDAFKNAISMAANSKYSDKQLAGMSTPQRISLLEKEQPALYNNLPEGFKHGRLVTKEDYKGIVEFFHKKDQETKSIEVTKSRWRVDSFKANNASSVLRMFK